MVERSGEVPGEHAVGPVDSASAGSRVPIRIALDYRPALYGRGGISLYTSQLARALAERRPDDRLRLFACRLRRRARNPEGPLPPSATLLDAPFPSQVMTVCGRFGFGVDRLVGGVDVLHWTDYVALPSSRARVVATVHDVLFEELPGCYTPAMRRGLRAATTRIVRTAHRLLVPSIRTRDALMAYYGVTPDAIDVVPHGAGPLPEGEPVYGYGPRYVLFLGTLEPRKNVMRLLEAHRRATREVPDLRLVLAGPRGWMDEEIVQRVGTQPGVTWEGVVGRTRLAALLRGASALAYPSLGEGFGLPVLEAMRMGRPVLVARETTCEDLAGDAGLAVDARDTEAMADALVRVATDEAFMERLGARGRARAAEYTWERTARETRASYVKALAA